MRFFFFLASLLILIQPLENESNIGSVESSSNELNDLSLDELNTKLVLAQGIAGDWEKKVNGSIEELGKKEKEANRLNQDYEHKKREWERLDKEEKEKNKGYFEESGKANHALLEFIQAERKKKDADDELTEANDEFTEYNGQLTTALATQAEINNRQSLFDAVELQLSKLTRPKKIDLENLEKDQITTMKDRGKAFNLMNSQKIEVARIACDGVGKENIPKCKEPLQIQKDLDKKFNEADAKYEKVLKDIKDHKKNTKEYDELIKKRDGLQTKVDDIPKDLPRANDAVNELENEKMPRIEKRVKTAYVNNRIINVIFEEKNTENEEAQDRLSNTPLDTKAQKDASHSSLAMERAMGEKNESAAEVEKAKNALKDLQGNLNEANAKVAALEQTIEKKRGGTPKEKFKWWIILIVLVILAIVAVVIFIVCRRRRQARKERENEKNVTAVAGSSKASSISSVPIRTVTPLVPSEKPSEAEKVLSDENSSNQPHEDKEVDPFNMPRGTKKEAVEILANNAIKGSKAVLKANGEIHFKCNCKLTGKIDTTYCDWRCEIESKDIKDGGYVVMCTRYAANHKNIHEESRKTVKKINAIEYNTDDMKKFEFGDGVTVIKEGPAIPKSEEGRRCSAMAKPIIEESGVIQAVSYMRIEDEEKEIFNRDKERNMSDITQLKYTNNRERYDFDFRFLLWICETASEIFKQEPRLKQMSHPCVVVGDVHGQYDTLHRMFAMFAKGGKPGWNQEKWIFTGDYVDRGKQSLETIVFLFLYKIMNPKSICLIRGNHEIKSTNKIYDFYKELEERFGDNATKLHYEFNKVFEMMPLGCVISDTILCVHGGISPHLKSLKDFEKIPKPIDTDYKERKMEPEYQLALDIMWSDYTIGAEEWAPNKFRGYVGQSYGVKQHKECLNETGIKLMIRGHQLMSNGLSNMIGHQHASIFLMMDDKRGKKQPENFAAVMRVNEDGRLSPRFLARCTNLVDMEKCVIGLDIANAVDFYTRFDKNKLILDYHTFRPITRTLIPTKDEDLTRVGVSGC